MVSKIWSALDPERRQIRLAHLAPSKELNEQPECFLSVVSLDDNPQYEALSYAWGNPIVTVPIRLRRALQQSTTRVKYTGLPNNSLEADALLNKKNSKPSIKRFLRSAKGIVAQATLKSTLSHNDDTYIAEWPVTTNLEQALRYLRHESKERVLWIDAICIDQSNIEERNHQVPFMKAIYSNALAVRVWLGPPTEVSGDAIKILKEMGRGVPLQEIRLDNHLLDDNNLRSVIELNTRPWWYRTWVQQEFVLAQKALIHCGPEFLEKDQLPSGQEITKMLNSANKSLRFSGTVTQELGKSFYAWTRIEYIMMVHQDPQSEDEEYIKLMSHGRLCRNSDERDSIYGFLGLLKEDICSNIKPDYDKSAADVFQDATIQLTVFSQSLIMLSLIQYTENIRRCMPTWVSSWHALNSPKGIEEWSRRSNRIALQPLFSACGIHAMSFQVLEPNVLKLSGARFDIVSSRGEVMELANIGVKETLQQTLEWRLLCFTDEVQGQSQYVTGGKKFEAFWRTLVNDLFQDTLGMRHRCEPQEHQTYLEWLAELENATLSHSESEKAICFSNSFSTACFNRRFFITKKGYFGIGPTELEVGDEICILAGGRLPFALRRLLGLQPDTFELIGDCYVHGIMDGKAVSDDMSSRVFEDITLDEIDGAQESDPDLPLREFHDIFIV